MVSRGTKHLIAAGASDGRILYVTSAFSLQFVTIDGQDNVILAVFAGGGLVTVAAQSALLSGAAVGVGVAAIKFLPLVYAPAFLCLSGNAAMDGRHRGGHRRSVMGVYASAASDPGPLQIEGSMKSAGNLPYVIEAISGRCCRDSCSTVAC